MKPDPKVATPEVEPKVEEQQQEAPAIEPASPPEGEGQEQRDETPEATFQQLQEDKRYKEDWDNLTRAQKEAKEKAYQDGQSAGAKQANKETREYAVVQKAIETFDDLEQKRLSQDPEELQEFANAMGKPRVKEAYEQGRSTKQGPGAQEMANDIFTTLDNHLNAREELQGISDEEKAGLAKERHPTIGALVDAKIDLAVKRGVAAGVKEASEKHDQEVRELARQEAKDELGMELPSDQIEGSNSKTDEKAKLDRILIDPHATQEQKDEAFTKKWGYRPRSR